MHGYEFKIDMTTKTLEIVAYPFFDFCFLADPKIDPVLKENAQARFKDAIDSFLGEHLDVYCDKNLLLASMIEQHQSMSNKFTSNMRSNIPRSEAIIKALGVIAKDGEFVCTMQKLKDMTNQILCQQTDQSDVCN